MTTDGMTTDGMSPTAVDDRAPRTPGTRRVDSSMSLLVDMMANTVDAAYAERARDRRAAPSGPGAPSRTGAGRLWPLAGLVAVGLLTGTAVAQVRVRSATDSGVRSGLAAEVRERTAGTDALAAEAGRLRAQVTDLQRRALGADAAGRSAARRLAALGLASATTPVEGPGLVVRLDDADAGEGPGTDPLRGGTVLAGRVSDQDVQDAVNGLWAAGAEAVAVNGQRLTTLSAIRSAGESVLVDLRPLSPPYVVQAIGDPAELEVDFVSGPSGRRLTTLTAAYGVSFEVSRDDELRLRGSGDPVLRQAEPGTGPQAPS